MFHGHNDLVTGVWLSEDGRRAFTASRDRTLRVWDVDASRAIHVLKGHLDEVRRIIISPNGQRGVSLSGDRTIRAWDLVDGRALRALVSSDNERALSLMRPTDALLQELERGPEVDVIGKPIRRDAQIAISAGGRHVVIGSHSSLRAWDLETGRTLGGKFDDFDVVKIAIDAEGEYAIVGSRFGSLLVWDLEHQRTTRLVAGHTEEILDIVVEPAGKRVVTAARDGVIRVWELRTLCEQGLLEGQLDRVDEIALASNGKLAYSVYGDTIVASNVVGLQHYGSLSFDHRITAIAVADDGTSLAAGDESGVVHYLTLER